jgi:hypothetical protein
MRKERNAASATFGMKPKGTGYLGVLLRCAACQGNHPWLRDTPCTTSQIAAFALTDIGEMSSNEFPELAASSGLVQNARAYFQACRNNSDVVYQ